MNEIIALEGIQTRYGDVIVLDDINLSIARGRPLALLGRNGAGKTTLLSTLAGLLRPTDGRLLIPRGTRVSYLPEERGVDDRLRASGLLRTALRRT